MPDLGLIHPALLASLADFYPATCTIQTWTETRSASGEVQYTAVDLTGHASIPCRIAPVRGQEVKRTDMTYAVGSHTVALRGHYTGITAKMLAVVGGINYDILAVEHDGQSKTTRLQVQVVT